MSDHVATLKNKPLPQLDSACFSRELSRDWSDMRQLRDQFWRGLNRLPFLQIERSRELLDAIEKESIARKVFTATSTWREQDREAVLSYLTAYKEPLTLHLHELQRCPTPSLVRVVSVILNEFQRPPEQALFLSRDVEKRWEQWGIVEREVLFRYGTREKVLQTSDPLRHKLLGFERDFGGSRKECENTVGDLLNARDQYTAIRDTIFLEHINLIWASSGHYDKTMKIPDVRQEAFLGLLYAIERFEPTLGNQFSTYAGPALKTFRSRCDHNFRNVAVAIPIGRAESFQHIRKAHQAGYVDLESIISELKMPEGVARALLVAARARSDLDSNCIDTKQELPDAAAIKDEIWRVLEKAQGALTEREYDVLHRHRGVYGEPETFRAIGESYNPPITKQGVQQIEARALEKIRRIMQRMFPDY